MAFLVLVALEASAAALLAARRLGAHSLWLDEAVAAQLTRLPAEDFAGYIAGREANSGLYFCVLRVWVSLFGDGEAALRSLSVVAAVGTVAAVALLARRLFGTSAGLLAGVVTATSPALIAGAQEARGFMLETGILTVSVVAFVDAVTTGGRRRWAMWTVLSVVAVYVHLLAVLLATSLLAALAPQRFRRARRAAAVCVGVVALATVPLAEPPWGIWRLRNLAEPGREKENPPPCQPRGSTPLS